ncbi:hypothetical protein hamaS1_28190 [Moorella sp. Hama-1]|nr:hypothetical protein hamaS1_28190 [Moorella sp. Hama-1]
MAELERLATAYYVTRELKGQPVERRSERLHELKPHIPLDEAKEAVFRVDRLLNELDVLPTPA